MVTKALEQISPWHIRQQQVALAQRNLLSRQAQPRTHSPHSPKQHPHSPPSQFSPRATQRPRLRKRLPSDLRQSFTLPPKNTPNLGLKLNLVPRVYRLFEQQAETMRRFSSQKEIAAMTPRPAHPVTISISLGRGAREKKELKFKTRSVRTLCHKPELKPKQKMRNQYESQTHYLKDKIEEIFKGRTGGRLQVPRMHETTLAKLKHAEKRLEKMVEAAPLAYQHVKNLNPVFSQQKPRREEEVQHRKFTLNSEHYLDRLLNKFE